MTKRHGHNRGNERILSVFRVRNVHQTFIASKSSNLSYFIEKKNDCQD